MLTAQTISDEDRLRLVLRRGLVVKIKGPAPFPSNHPHHFVVLNYQPTTESIIILTHATHQYQKECEKADKQGEDVTKTVIYITPGTYRFFPRPTVFNCSEPSEFTFIRMVEALKNGDLTIPRNDLLTEAHIQKLVDGVLASKQVTPGLKALVQPQ